MEAARQADPAKVKKYLVPDVVNFKHPYTGDTPLVSTDIACWSCNLEADNITEEVISLYGAAMNNTCIEM